MSKTAPTKHKHWGFALHSSLLNFLAVLSHCKENTELYNHCKENTECSIFEVQKDSTALSGGQRRKQKSQWKTNNEQQQRNIPKKPRSNPVMSGPHFWIQFLIENLGLSVFMLSTGSTGNTRPLLQLCVPLRACTAERIAVKELQMQHNSYTSIVLRLHCKVGKWEECKNFYCYFHM